MNKKKISLWEMAKYRASCVFVRWAITSLEPVMAHIWLCEYTIFFDRSRESNSFAISGTIVKTKKKKKVSDNRAKILSINVEVLEEVKEGWLEW